MRSQVTQADRSRNALNRRSLLAALSASTGAALAGCLGDDDGDGDSGDSDSGDSDADDGDDGSTELGDPVDTFEIPAGTGGGSLTVFAETAGPVMKQNWEEHLGLDTEINSVDFVTLITEFYGDGREHNAFPTVKRTRYDKIEPIVLLREMTCEGSATGLSQSHLCSCEFDETIQEYRTEPDPERREELAVETLAVGSSHTDRLNLMEYLTWGAYRNDLVEFDELGDVGLASINWQLMLNATPLEGDTIVRVTDNSTLPLKNHLTPFTDYFFWSNIVYSPMITLNSDFGMSPGLATDWTQENDAREFTYTLRDDATFHDGEPVTAEDVVWTYEYINENYDVFVEAEQWDYETLEAVDETTVHITFEQPSPVYNRTFVGLHGILPKHYWVEQGAEENPASFVPDEIIGSGPFEVNNFQQEELLEGVPHEGHFLEPEHRIVYQAFDNFQSSFRAFQEGSVHITTSLGVEQKLQAEEMDTATVQQTTEIVDWFLVPYWNYGPTKFYEFREAISQVIDRQQINEQVYRGNADISHHSSMIGINHPLYPDNPDEVLTRVADADTPSPDVAKGLLEDAGWGWDDDGNLHYPPNADLDPLWTKEETALDYKEEVC